MILTVANDISSRLGHGHALRRVPGSCISLRQLQALWQLKGMRRNLQFIQDERPEFCGLAGWAERLWDGWSYGYGLNHISCTGRIQVWAVERVSHRYIEQELVVEAWAGTPEPRPIMRLLMSQVVSPTTGHPKLTGYSLDSWGGLWCVAARLDIRPEDYAERADRLAFLVELADAYGIRSYIGSDDDKSVLIAARDQLAARAAAKAAAAEAEA